jgi:hypothetical protein
MCDRAALCPLPPHPLPLVTYMWDPHVIFNLQPLERCPAISAGVGRPEGGGGGRPAGLRRALAPGGGRWLWRSERRWSAGRSSAADGGGTELEDDELFDAAIDGREGPRSMMTLLHPRRSVPTAHPELRRRWRRGRARRRRSPGCRHR